MQRLQHRNCCWAATSFFPGLCHPLLTLPCHTGQSVSLPPGLGNALVAALRPLHDMHAGMQTPLPSIPSPRATAALARHRHPISRFTLKEPDFLWNLDNQHPLYSTTTTTNYSTTTVDFVQTHRLCDALDVHQLVLKISSHTLFQLIMLHRVQAGIIPSRSNYAYLSVFLCVRWLVGGLLV